MLKMDALLSMIKARRLARGKAAYLRRACAGIAAALLLMGCASAPHQAIGAMLGNTAAAAAPGALHREVSAITPYGSGPEPPAVEEPMEQERACLAFALANIISADGAVRAMYYAAPPTSADAADASQVLSESQGLAMEYAVLCGDRVLFDLLWGFTHNNLDTGEVFAWRLREGEPPSAVNAAIDDLRIIRALFGAAETFGDDSYAQTAEVYAARLYDTNVRNGALCDFYDAGCRVANNYLTLCYADFTAIGMAAAADGRWKALEEPLAALVQNGYLGDALPLYPSRYLHAEGRYENSEPFNMAEALYAALHLSRAGLGRPETLEFLRTQVDEGILYGRYTADGRPGCDFESAAVYALAAMVALQEGDRALYEQCIALMENLRIDDPEDPMYGAFGDSYSGMAYAFDNILALLAYRSGLK